MTCRCVSPPRVLSCPHLVEAYFSNILLTATTARPRPCPSRADLARSSRPPPRADAGPPARGGLRPPRRGLEAARVLRRHAHVRPRARSPRRTTRETRLALVFRETQRKTKTFFFRLRIRRSQSVKETPRFFLVTTRIRREDVKVFTSVATSSDHSLVSKHRLYVALTLCAPRTYTMCICVSFLKKTSQVLAFPRRGSQQTRAGARGRVAAGHQSRAVVPRRARLRQRRRRRRVGARRVFRRQRRLLLRGIGRERARHRARGG